MTTAYAKDASRTGRKKVAIHARITTSRLQCLNMLSSQTALPTKMPPPPRQVRRRRGSGENMGCMIFFMIPFVLVGLAIGGNFPLRMYVRAHGTPISMTIDSKRVRHSSKNNTITHYLKCHYLLNGQLRVTEENVKEQDYRRLMIGQTISGRAIQIGSWVMCVTSLEDASSLAGAVVFFVIWNSFIVLYLSTFLVPLLRERKALRYGMATVGVIVKDRQQLNSKGSQSTFYLTFTFKTAHDVEVTREVKIVQKMYEAAEIGSAVTVLYDPLNPKRAVAYEYSHFELVPMVG